MVKLIIQKQYLNICYCLEFAYTKTKLFVKEKHSIDDYV